MEVQAELAHQGLIGWSWPSHWPVWLSLPAAPHLIRPIHERRRRFPTYGLGGLKDLPLISRHRRWTTPPETVVRILVSSM